MPPLSRELSLNPNIVFTKKIDLNGDQYFKTSKSSLTEVGFIVRNLLMQKEKDIFPILSFGIEAKPEKCFPSAARRIGRNTFPLIEQGVMDA